VESPEQSGGQLLAWATNKAVFTGNSNGTNPRVHFNYYWKHILRFLSSLGKPYSPLGILHYHFRGEVPFVKTTTTFHQFSNTETEDKCRDSPSSSLLPSQMVSVRVDACLGGFRRRWHILHKLHPTHRMDKQTWSSWAEIHGRAFLRSLDR
jgi:hypothetical protein